METPKQTEHKHTEHLHAEHQHAEHQHAEHGQPEPKKSSGFKIKPLHIFGAIAILIVIYLGISYLSVPVVAAGDTVQVNYTGTFTNGTVFDSSAGKQPLQFIVGSGQIIPGFDHAVVGMKLNQEKTITLQPSDAYGNVNPALIIQVPANTFKNQTMQVGMGVIRTVSGQQEQGVVTGINSTTITVDFNPPLAGQTLIFKIDVVGIQKAK